MPKKSRRREQFDQDKERRLLGMHGTASERLVLSDSDEVDISQGRERLADFIRHNHGAIVKEWVEFARTRSPASDGMSRLALQNHVVDILNFIATDLESPQTRAGTGR
jgi:hypothetical protein